MSRRHRLGWISRARFTLCLLLIAPVTICACGSTAPPQARASRPALVSQPLAHATGASAVAHLGCSEYCQTAGGYGDGGAPPPRAMILLSSKGPVAPLPDGSVPLTFTCLFTTRCLGTVFLDSLPNTQPPFSNIDHSSDLVVNGHGASRTIAVPLPGMALKQLRARGTLRVSVSADLGWSFCPQLVNPKAYDCWPASPRSDAMWRSLELDSWTIALSSA